MNRLDKRKFTYLDSIIFVIWTALYFYDAKALPVRVKKLAPLKSNARKLVHAQPFQITPTLSAVALLRGSR